MTEQQAARIIELLEGIQKTLDGLTGPKRIWNPEAREYHANEEYRSLNVDIVDSVEIQVRGS